MNSTKGDEDQVQDIWHKCALAKVVADSKWQSTDSEASTSKGKITETDEIVIIREQGLLGRCIFGSFGKNKAENPTLFDDRRCPQQCGRTLLESIHMRCWMATFSSSSPTGTWRNRSPQENGYGRETNKSRVVELICRSWTSYIQAQSTSLRVMGLWMHLWTDETFHEIGDLWGGWLAMEEETKLRNHLKCARIEIREDGGTFQVKSLSLEMDLYSLSLLE